LLKRAAIRSVLLVAAGIAACGGGSDKDDHHGAKLRAADAIDGLPKREGEVARVMVLLERGLHDGDVRLLCERVYDPRDVGSEKSCQTTLAGLSKGDDQLTIAPRSVDVTGRSAVIRADVTRSPGPVREHQMFRVRHVSGDGWRVHLVL
jgi:hypothetical protein